MTPLLYRTTTRALAPIIPWMLRRRLRRGKEDPRRLLERFGVPSQPRMRGPLIWFHAASVGESLSVLGLIGRLLQQDPQLHVLLTSNTVTSARLMAQRLPPRAVHQYVPVDRLDAVRQFLRHWHPDLAIWVESEFWPNLVFETRRAGIPMVLLNARISERAFRRWRRLPWLIRPLLRAFDLCLAQSLPDAGRLGSLGAPTVVCHGNLKTAAGPLPAEPKTLERLARSFGERPRWLAASTHPGEEEQAAGVQRRLRARHHGLLTLLLPRHPERGPEIAASLKKAGLSVARRAAHEPVRPDTDVYLIDTLGETGLFYRLAGIAFVGGSLVPHGGQNLFEPAHLDCAILHGPHMWNFADMARSLHEASASEEVPNTEALSAAVDRLLSDPALRGARAAAAGEVAGAAARVLDLVLADLQPWLPLEERRRASA